MKKIVLPLVAGLLFVVGCAKGPAQAALTAAQQAFDGAKASAMEYVPDQAKAVQDALNAAQDSFNKGDYKAALAGAQDVTAKVQGLASAVAAKKEALTKSWQAMSESLPKMVEGIKTQIDTLSKAKRLPPGMDKKKIEEAKSGAEALGQMWQEATTASTGGKLVEAVAKATAVQTKATEVMALLGMPAPAPQTETAGKQ